MIEPVSAHRVGGAAALQMQDWASPANPAAPDPTDVSRFETAMADKAERVDGVEVAQLETNSTWVIAPPAGAEAAQGAPSIGERVVDGLTSYRDAFESTALRMQELNQGGVLINPGDALRMQWQMTLSTITIDLVTKEVGGVSRKLDGLLKTG